MIYKNKRNDIEIMAQMLKLAQEEIIKTHLMYQTNLSYNQLVYYTDFLLKKGLMDVRNSFQNNRYFITEKGKEFLDNIEKIIVQVR